MSRLLIFGMGYTANALAARLRTEGWRVTGTTRDGRGDTLRFVDRDAVFAEMAAATHVLSSVPPEGEDDPVWRGVLDVRGGGLDAEQLGVRKGMCRWWVGRWR